MIPRLVALLLPAAGLVLVLPAPSAVAAPLTSLSVQVGVAAPYVHNPNLNGSVGRAFH